MEHIWCREVLCTSLLQRLTRGRPSSLGIHGKPRKARIGLSGLCLSLRKLWRWRAQGDFRTHPGRAPSPCPPASGMTTLPIHTSRYSSPLNSGSDEGIACFQYCMHTWLELDIRSECRLQTAECTLACAGNTDSIRRLSEELFFCFQGGHPRRPHRGCTFTDCLLLSAGCWPAGSGLGHRVCKHGRRGRSRGWNESVF